MELTINAQVALSALCTLLSMAGAYLVAKDRVLGYYLWVGSNSGWLLFATICGVWEQVPLWLFYLATTIIGIRTSRRRSASSSSNTEPAEDATTTRREYLL